MEYIKLGRTGIEVSRLCIGCWQAAGWASSDDDRFVKTVQHAIDLGLNFLDTASLYGNGHSEELVAKAIKGKRDKLIIATKFDWQHNSPQKLRESLEESLTRLDTDYIDIYQQHWPSYESPLVDIISEMEKLKEEGKIRVIGVSNWLKPEWEEFDDPSRIESLQPCHSLLWRSFEPDALPVCRKHNIAVIPYSSLAQGVLTGRYKSLADTPKDQGKNDPRVRNQLFEEERFKKELEIVEVLKKIGEKYNKTCAQTALRWLLDQDGITAPIVGASHPEQVDDNIGALDWNLEKDDWQKLSDISKPISENLKPFDSLWYWHPKTMSK